MTTKFAKTLLTVLVFAMSIGTFANTGTTSNNNNAANATAVRESYCGVTDLQIIEYLGQFGYEVKSICSITGTCNVLVTTQYKYRTIVYINEDGITGHDDIQL